MTKKEFLEKMRLALNGKVPGNVVTENLQYYEDYINTEIRKGKSEEEVLSSLGDPRLIARTIIITSGNRENTATDEGGEYNSGRSQNGIKGHLPVWGWLIFGILIIVLIFSAVISLISFLWPILLPIIIIMAIMFLVKFFRDWIN